MRSRHLRSRPDTGNFVLAALMSGALLAATPSFAETYHTTVKDVDEALARYVSRCPDRFGDGVRGPIVLFPSEYPWKQYKDTFVDDVTRVWNDVLRAAPVKRVFKNDDGSKISGPFEACAVVRFSISKNGDVDDVEVLDSRGPSSLKELALAAIKKLRPSGSQGLPRRPRRGERTIPGEGGRRRRFPIEAVGRRLHLHLFDDDAASTLASLTLGSGLCAADANPRVHRE